MPEVTIKNKPVSQLRGIVTNYFVDRGWTPVQTEGSQLVFQHASTAGQDFMMGLLTDNPQSTNRITITLVENGADVRVVGGVAIMGANTFGRPQVVELRGKGYQQLQAELEQIKKRAGS